MVLNYIALAILLVALTLVFYLFIYIHDIPYNIAKKKHHPQKDVIHVACWLSLFTLHAIWPLVFMWAVSEQKPIQINLHEEKEGEPSGGPHEDDRLAELEARVRELESAVLASKGALIHD
jgi:Protein of unknown function (DUF3302)